MWIIATVAGELAAIEPPAAFDAAMTPAGVEPPPDDPQPARIDSATSEPAKISPARLAGECGRRGLGRGVVDREVDTVCS
jgi:hypothetical protein